MSLTKSDLKALSKLPAALQLQARAEMEAKNKLDAEARRNNPKFLAMQEARRQRRQQPLSIKIGDKGTCVSVKVPGFAFPVNFFPEQYDAIVANAEAIKPLVEQLRQKRAAALAALNPASAQPTPPVQPTVQPVGTPTK